MENEPTATPQAEAAPVAQVEPAEIIQATAEPVSREDIVNAALSGATPATLQRLEAAFAGQKAKPEAVTATPEPEPIAEPSAEELPEPEPEPESAPAGVKPQEPQAEKDQGRFRFSDTEDKAVAMLAKAKGISLVEAAQIFAGVTKAEPAEAVASAVTHPEIQEIETEIASHEEALAQMDKDRREYLADPQIFASELADLEAKRDRIHRDISRADAKLESAKLRAQQAADRQTEQVTESDRIMEPIVRDYPDMADADSDQWVLARTISQRLRKAGDARANDSRFVAEEAAKKLGIKPAGVQPAVQAASSAAKAEIKPGPAPGSRTTAPPAQQLTAKQREAQKLAETDAILSGRNPNSPKTRMIGELILR